MSSAECNRAPLVKRDVKVKCTTYNQARPVCTGIQNCRLRERNTRYISLRDANNVSLREGCRHQMLSEVEETHTTAGTSEWGDPGRDPFREPTDGEAVLLPGGEPELRLTGRDLLSSAIVTAPQTTPLRHPLGKRQCCACMNKCASADNQRHATVN